MVTSTPPALGLGVERAAPDIMSQPPRTAKEGIFSAEVLCDIFFYGLSMGGIALANYLIALFAGPFNHQGPNVPHSCNEHYKPECEDVFRARGAAFGSLSLMLLQHAYNCRDMRRSAFSQPLRDNKLLFYTVIVGVFLVVPTFYIPGLNTIVLKQRPLDWEWGMIVCGMITYQAMVESYKFCKRRFLTKPVPSDVIRASLAKFESLTNIFNEPRDVRDFDPGASHVSLPSARGAGPAGNFGLNGTGGAGSSKNRSMYSLPSGPSSEVQIIVDKKGGVMGKA